MQNTTENSGFRAGDVVKHRPTGETWRLAVDQFSDEVSPLGWPETIAKAEDCELVEASDEDLRYSTLINCSRMGYQADVRCRQARNTLIEEKRWWPE